MKKILVITVLALFLALPVMAVTNWDFTVSGTDGDAITTLKLNGVDSNLIIKSGSKAQSLTLNADGTLDIVNAATSTFKIYPASASTVNVIKIASSSTGAYTSCTTFTDAIATPIVIASTTDEVATSTVTLISLSNAVTYNHFCGAASCDTGYNVAGTNASATCARNSGGSNPPSGGSPSPVACTTVTYNDWQTACTNSWQYRTVASQSPSGCTLTTAQDNDKKKACVAVACTAVVYDVWQTACTNSWQSRNVTSQSPSGCALTTTQENDKKRSCNTPVAPETPATPTSAAEQIRNIVAEAATIAGRSVESVLAAVGAMRDAKAEAASQTKYTNSLVAGLKNITAEMKTVITNFINYGTPTTKILGAGERAGVVNSYKAAFGKVPTTEAEWSDVIKIGNGRWPSVKNATAEAKAAVEFKKIYKRTANMNQPNDNAAVTVISYGLRPANRNLNSEKAAIKSFRAIYGHAPVSALAWDIVRAIAYSGAKR